MKNKAGIIVPLIMILLGGYVLLRAVGVSEEQVTLFASHQIPQGLAMVFGLIGVGGGIFVILSMLTGKTRASS